MATLTISLRRVPLVGKKRGAFLTLGVFIVGVVLLAQASFIFENARQSEDIVVALASIDRIYEIDTSLQQSVQKIFFERSGISISMTNGSVAFLENMPNTAASGFNASMKSLESFVEETLPDVNISSQLATSQLPLSVSSLDINYTHSAYGGNDILVKPQQQNFIGYRVVIVLNQNVTGCQTDMESPGSLNFSYFITGPNGNACESSSTIQWGEESEIGVNGEDLKIEIEDGTLSIVFDEPTLSGTVNTTILASVPPTASISLPPAYTTIFQNATGARKESSVALMRLPS